jgi:hypothetical protein
MKARTALIGLALVATACGSQPTAQPKVATLATPSSTPSSTTASPAPAERARYRLDMTDQERQDLLRPYTRCMQDHGVNVIGQRQGTAPKADQQTADKAAEACDPLLPLPPWEEDATNPEAMDFAKKVVDCLRAKGVRYVEVSSNSGMVGPSFGGSANDQESITRGMELTPVCAKEVAGPK